MCGNNSSSLFLITVALICTLIEFSEQTTQYLSDERSEASFRDSVQSIIKYLYSKDELHLKYARGNDTDDCLLRVICEISSNTEDPSESLLIKTIRNVFGIEANVINQQYKLKSLKSLKSKETLIEFICLNRQNTFQEKQSSERHNFAHKYAGFVGHSSGSAERCLQVFPVCPLNTALMLRVLNNHRSLTPKFDTLTKPVKKENIRRLQKFFKEI